MTLFEVTDTDGSVVLIDCDEHCISGEAGGPIVHDFVHINRFGERIVADGVPLSWRFVAPQSVREVPR